MWIMWITLWKKSLDNRKNIVHIPIFGVLQKITGKKSYSQKNNVKKISTAIVFYSMLIRLWIMWIS